MDPSGTEYGPPQPARPLEQVYAELGHTLLAEGRAAGEAGDRLLAERRFAAAVDAFGRAARRKPDVAVLQLHLADACLQNGQPAVALRAYVHAAELSDAVATDALRRAQPLLTGELARRHRGLIDRWRDRSWPAAAAAVHSFLGRLASLVGEDAIAVQHWRLALTAQPDDLAAMEQLGTELRRIGEPKEAAAVLHAACARADERDDRERRGSLRLALGETLLAAGESDEAERVLIEALPLVDAVRHGAVRLALARSLAGRGESGAALEAAAAAAGDPMAPVAVRADAAVLRAELFAGRGEPAEAAAEAKIALGLVPTHATAILVRARALLDTGGEADQALRLVQVYLRQRPDDLQGHRLLARALRGAGRPPLELAAALEQLAARVPAAEQAPVRLDLAEAQIAGGLSEAARATLDEVAERDPGLTGDPRLTTLRDRLDVVELRHRAEERSAAGDPGAAALLWRTVAERSGSDAEVQLRLAEASLAAGDDEAAREAAQSAYLWGSGYDIEVAAQLLLARVAERAEEPVARADALLEAGRRRYWQGEHMDEARQLLEESHRLRSDHPLTMWYLADLALIRSMRPDGRLDPQAVDDGLRWWAEAARLAQPDAETSWTLLTRAFLLVFASRMPNADTSELTWESMVALERGLLLAETNSAMTAQLAACHLNLRNLRHAREIIDAVPADVRAGHGPLSQQGVAILVNEGRYDEAMRALEEPGAFGVAWSSAVLAMLHRRHGDPAKSVAPARAAVAEEPDDADYIALLAEALTAVGERSAAIEHWERVWNRRDVIGEIAQVETICFAGYMLAVLASPPKGELLDQVITRLESARDDRAARPHEEPNISCNLALSYLAAGRLAHGRRAMTGVLETANVPADVDNVIDDLTALRKLSAEWPHARLLAGELDVLGAAAATRRAALDRARLSAAQELVRALPAGPGSWPETGALAGLARRDLAAGRLARAAHRYRTLLDASRPPFPEAAIALRHIADTYRDRGDQAFRGGDSGGAVRQWRLARAALLGAGADDSGMSQVSTRLSFGALTAGDPRAARDAVHAALIDADPAAIGRTGVALISEPEQYWRLDDQWAALAADGDLGAVVTEVRTALRAYLIEALEIDSSEEETQYPVVAPIVLELGAGLVADNTSTEGWSLFQEYIPDMRGAIESDLGITVPGVRARPNAAIEDGEYVIRLDECMTATGRVPLDMTWFADPAARTFVPGRFVSEDPRTGRSGRWVTAAEAAELRASGHSVETEPIEFVIHHLEAQLRVNCAAFLGIEEGSTLLDRWGQDSELAALIGAAAPDPVTRLRLLRLLRGLVAERVPLTAPREIVTAARDFGLRTGNITAAVDAVRRAVPHLLAGNAAHAVRFRLPAKVEKDLAGIPAGAVTEYLLAAIPDAPDLVVVTSTSELRRVARRLLRGRRPVLDVLTVDELRDSPVEKRS
ncbi:FHIPEP family type III secretion protein [Actinoplanes sp. NPDC051861]|uniref:FHIPEP family type III secretion protein n=1 Tax=Actinoplanes sp. NPDC051861 TaxID=3155170 RepID=UPI00343F079E